MRLRSPPRLLALLPLLGGAAGEGSAPLLGGKYVPTTDVEYITDLVELVEAIAAEDDIDQGESLYKRVVPDGISIESINGAHEDDAVPQMLDETTNPLYPIYMYAYWRSHHGTGASDGGERPIEARDSMKFDGAKVDYYGHKIISDEFTKTSGYNSTLTADTVRANNIWMGAVQGLYDAVDLCVDRTDVDLDAATFVNPIDKTAAFVFGTLEDEAGTTEAGGPGSGGLYAWAKRIDRWFSSPYPIVGSVLSDGLVALQSKLASCLEMDEDDDGVDDAAAVMRVAADELARNLTVPLVQELIHWAALVSADVQDGLEPEANTVDYMILYGLAALPPIVVCDENDFHDLYNKTVTHARSLDPDLLYDLLEVLYSRLVCLGITCDQVGESRVLADAGLIWPECRDLSADVVVMAAADDERMLRHLKVDLDVRTIGTLVEMDSRPAAYQVYHWGRHSFDVTGTRYIALQDIATKSYTNQNWVGKAYDQYFNDRPAPTTANMPDEKYVDRHEYQAMLAIGDFSGATPTQRRIITESSMVLMTLLAHALDDMHTATAKCQSPTVADADDGLPPQALWERAFASLSGWAEYDGKREGFLFMEVSRFLGDTPVNGLLIAAFEEGRTGLNNFDCDIAQKQTEEVERLIQVVLVDLVAYFAEELADDPADEDNRAEAFGVATSLEPIMAFLPPGSDAQAKSDADTIKRNMGSFGPTAPSPMADGLEAVIAALGRHADRAGLDCSLITREVVCAQSTMSPGSDMGAGYQDSDQDNGQALDQVEDEGGGDDQPAAAGTGSPVSLGGKYSPKTNVQDIVGLMEIIESIATDDNQDSPETLYKQTLPSGMSLATITWNGEDGTRTPDLNAETNPLYSIYMYAYWRSHHGSGASDAAEYPDESRDEMKFLDEKVDYYGHKIIMDEILKPSGYNATLTAETIRATNIWMAVVQSLYDAVDMCDEMDTEIGFIDTTSSTFVSPVDRAAAFWFGTLEDANDVPQSGRGSGSMYAWTKSIHDLFTFPGNPSPFYANDEIVRGLVEMQTLLESCMEQGAMIDGELPEGPERDMRALADDVVRYMTVPMVQSLIHHWARVATGMSDESDANIEDYLILYGLVTLPPIIVCDERAFHDLYDRTVRDAKRMDTDMMVDGLKSLYDRLICLEVSCDYIGKSTVLADHGSIWPECEDPYLKEYQGSNPEQLLEYLKVDLDIRTIGTLVAMDAKPASYDVYHWGRHSKDMGDGSYQALQSLALEEYHAHNWVGKSFDSYFSTSDSLSAGSKYADKHEFQAMMALGKFASATATQRRIITESSMVTITMHAFALNNMYMAIDLCRVGQGSDAGNKWDRAFASLSGWATVFNEGGDGFLLMGVAQFLCDAAGTCGVAGNSEINMRIIDAMEIAKPGDTVSESTCGEMEAQTIVVEKLILTILVDIIAYFAERLEEDPLDVDNLAEAYGVATALVPLMNHKDPDGTGADIIEQNMGQFGGSENPLQEGKSAVFEALASFARQADLYCDLLTVAIGCSESSAQGNQGILPGPTLADDDYPTRSPTLMPSFFDDEDDDDYYETMTSDEVQFCESGIDGGIPNAFNNTVSAPLLGGAYEPTSNVDHIIQLTKQIELIETSTLKPDGYRAYTQANEKISLQCLSTESRWTHITTTNPLYIIYMYGLWISDDGDNDSDGYSNKIFDEEPILNYGDTIIMDVMDKKSGFDGMLVADAVRVISMWMATATELYRAADSCRNGYIHKAAEGFNPVDFAAALWFGTGTKGMAMGGSLYAWAEGMREEFTEERSSANAEIELLLKDMQQRFKSCKNLSGELQESAGIQMKHAADELIRWMVVPVVHKFIHHLATESGMQDEPDDERNYMVLYALAALPMVSICDEDGFDDLFYDLVSDVDSYDSSTFTDHLANIQDHYECLGITCDMVGKSTLFNEAWPECIDPSPSNRKFAGYQPTSPYSLEMSKMDLDISTLLTFIIMDAKEAALDIYKYGRNAKDETNSQISLQALSIPTEHPDSLAVYELFSTDDGVDYTQVTKHAIMGEEAFSWASPLLKSAAASLAIATIDAHISILDSMYEAIECEENGQTVLGWDTHWDQAVALAVGWTEGEEDAGAGQDSYLFYQVAQELCAHFDSCDEDGQSVINKKLMEEFKKGQESLKNNQCEEATKSQEAIERYLQAILVDNLAYHSKNAQYQNNDRHCLLAHVAKSALLPLIHPVDDKSAEKIELSMAATSAECRIDDTEAIRQGLNDFVQGNNIDCSLLGSSVVPVCDGVSTEVDLGDLENDSTYVLNTIADDPDTDENERFYLLNKEYEPMADVKKIHGISMVVNTICDSTMKSAAKAAYTDDVSAGISIESMSISAKFAMARELQFNQYVYALKDGVDKTDGSAQFDNKPATEYANTISSDALDTQISLGCLSVKVLNIWAWIVHRLNNAVEACVEQESANYGDLDEAAALWEGGLLFQMAENLGPKFGHTRINGMTVLNRMIVDRFKKARGIIYANSNECDAGQGTGLRIIVKEIVSYMTAVLIQKFIDSMLDGADANTKTENVELMAFATLPHITACGHENTFETLYKDLIEDGFEESMIGETIGVLQSHYNCIGLTCGSVGRHTAGSNTPQCSDNLDIVGYAPANATKTNMIAKLDLDAVAIHQMMTLDRNDVAKRIYLEGHNYYDYDNPAEYGFVSLHNFTQKHTIDYTDFETYKLFSDYLEPDFANSLIIEAFDKTGRFASPSANQRDLAVNIAISSMVSYMAALEAFYYSTSKCASMKAAAQTAFDGAVALLVGSVEGRGRGGNQYHEGRMLFSVSKRTCEHFHSCHGASSTVNFELYRVLSEGKNFIEQGSCGDLLEAVEAINALLKVPLLQSLLYFSDTAIASHSDNDAAGYVAAMASLPILNDIDPSSADTIKSVMDFTSSSSLNSASTKKEETVYSALGVVFSNVKIKSVVDCELVTEIERICYPDKTNGAQNDGEADGDVVIDRVDDDEVIKMDEPMPISDGLYVATNYVGDRSAIALDVKEIQERLSADDFEEAKHYYAKGLNSKVYGENGIPTGEVRSISRFSTEAEATMKGDPTYNLFIYALSDENQEFLGRPVTRYADSFISDLLYSQSLAAADAADAMVATTIWMQVAHSLHSAYGACKSSFLADGRTMDGRNLQSNDPALMIDEAAAYWIGDNQATGSAIKGHLLYALAETVGAQFEKIPPGAESTINSAIVDLFNKAKNHIAISRGCSTSGDSHLKLKGIIDELIPLMAVPLLRSLIYYMSRSDPVMVKIYAVAVLPLFAPCNPSTYNELKAELIDHDIISMQKLYLYSKLQSMYNCLGLTCDMVGYMLQDQELRCEDSSDSKSLAGYRYATEQAVMNAASRADVTTEKVNILIENGIYHFPQSIELLFGTAFDLYKYGEQLGDTMVSLSSMARDTNKDIVPVFESFRRYFKNDGNYADTLIVNAFKKKGIFAKATVSKRKRVIAFTLKYMVTHMAILEKLYSTIQSCESDKRKEGSISLDMAAGYYVGSLEGKDDGGSFDGEFIFMLAKRMCVHFGTCTDSNNARINERIINLLYAAQGEIETGACGPLERTVKEIENYLIVPLIQGVLFSAKINQRYFNEEVPEEFYPEGYALALSVLPLISDADKDSARDIENVMVAFFPGRSDDPGANYYMKVHRAVQQAVSKIDGVDCSEIGELDGHGFCTGDVELLSLAPSNAPSLILLPITVMLYLSLF